MQKKLISTAIGAFGLGALVSWAVTADFHERRLVKTLEGTLKVIDEKTEFIKYQRDYILGLRSLVDEAVNSTDGLEEYDLAQMTLDEDLSELSDETMVEFIDTAELIEDIAKEFVPDEPVEETRANLQKLIDQYTANPDYSSEEVFRPVSQSVESDHSQPFIISREDFAYDEVGQNYAKITLTYFPRERVLLDEDEDVEDVARTVGFRNLTHFGDMSEDADTVFIRNDRLEADFEVVKDEDPLPLHIRYGMGREEFRVNKAAGLIKLRREDE